jgi:hypothetical protein
MRKVKMIVGLVLIGSVLAGCGITLQTPKQQTGQAQQGLGVAGKPCSGSTPGDARCH